jgi:hypothetical protein
MPISIAAAQKAYSFDVGEDKAGFELFEARTEFEKYGDKFKKTVAKLAEQRGVVDTGKVAGDCQFIINEAGNQMLIYMPDYYDFPNEGVKGKDSSKNAPKSPYKFKSYGMSTDGRKSIKNYIQRGRAKIETVRKTNDKALGIGREKKHLPLIDIQTEQLVYMIKKYGIKATHYFTYAVNQVFGKEFELNMAEALGRDIVFTLEKINK